MTSKSTTCSVTKIGKPLEIEQIVINWHVTEACNFKCSFCYAKWNDKHDNKELIHHPKKAIRLLRELYKFFSPDNLDNPLIKRMQWKSVRINFAGGETLLYKNNIHELINEAKKIGFDVSIITNGSTLTPILINKLAPNLSILGVSLDSRMIATNKLIGRIDRKGNQINIVDLVSCLELAREINPKMEVKINTVINKLNFDEDMNSLIKTINPNKWKALQVLPVITNDLQITSKQFQLFIENHKQHKTIMSLEDNERMQGSYLMIDPLGRFFQNSKELESDYTYSKTILSEGVGSALNDIEFSIEKFFSRYINAEEEK